MEDPGRCWRLPCPDLCSCPHGRGVSVLSPRAPELPLNTERTQGRPALHGELRASQGGTQS